VAFVVAVFLGGLFSLTLIFPSKVFPVFVVAGLQTGAVFLFFSTLANQHFKHTIQLTPGQQKIRNVLLIFGIASNVPACYPAPDAASSANPRLICLP